MSQILVPPTTQPTTTPPKAYHARSRLSILGVTYTNIGDYKNALRGAILSQIAKGHTSSREIGKALVKGHVVIFNEIRALEKEGLISRSPTGRLLKTQQQVQQEAYQKLETDAFVQTYPEVKEWVNSMLVRKDGQPIKKWRNMLTAFQTVCDTLKLSPSAFTISPKQSEQLAEAFVIKMQKGEIIRQRHGNKHKIHCKYPRNYISAIANFCAKHSITWPRGISGVMSRKKQNFGAYAHIKLTQEEIAKARQYFKEKGDFEALFFFDFGRLTCARSESIITTEVSRFELNSQGWLIGRIFESKTQKWWTKYIPPWEQEVQQEYFEWVQKHPGQRYLFVKDTGYEVDLVERRMSGKLKELYQHLGKTDDYFYRKPIHTLRHIGAHYWLRLTDYNHSLVARIGGWDDVSTLVKCYGEIPEDFTIKALARCQTNA